MGRTKGKAYEIPAGRLWPNMPSGAPVALEVFGATGEYKSGKTLLGLSIAPGVHPEGHKSEGQPRTLYLDFEKSGGTYTGTGAKRIDVPSVMAAKGIAYTPINVFKWFLEAIKATEEGRYDVIHVDPATDIEAGEVDYVKANCQVFGLTPNQVAKSSGLLWGAVKSYWKQILLTLSTRCQTFYFTAHLRNEWSGDRPTGKREPKGKDTLQELASLYLWLERKPDDKGAVAPAPSAKVLKERLSDTRIDAAGNLEILPLMPPHLAVATVVEIRRYIADPPDYKRLRVGEKVPAETFTEEEKLRLELAKAAAEQATEESRLERLTRMAELQATQQAGQTVAPPAVAEAAKEPAKAEVEKAEAEHPSERPAEQPTASADLMEQAFAPPALGKASKAQQAELHRLFDVTAINEDTQAALLGRVNAATVEDLSKEHACLLIEKLVARAGKMQAEAAKGEAAGN